MNCIHINWTKVYERRHPGEPFRIRDHELLTTILGALSWQKHNGSIRMITDSQGRDAYCTLGLESLWDNGITTELDRFSSYRIDPDYFWAAGKIMALSVQEAPVVMMDTDFILWDTIDFRFFSDQIAVIHREDLNGSYPDAGYFSLLPGYAFPKELDWTVLPCNTAFAYFGNQRLLEQYTRDSLDFMLHAVPDDPITYMVFAEQRLLPMTAARLGVRIYDLSGLAGLFYSGQRAFTHLWGYKSRLDQDPEALRQFCRLCIRRIKKEYPWFLDTLCRIPQLNRYL